MLPATASEVVALLINLTSSKANGVIKISNDVSGGQER